MSGPTCLDEKQLRTLLDESAPANELTAFTHHLENCRLCRLKLEEIAGELSVPAAAEKESISIHSDSVLDSLIVRLKREPSGREATNQRFGSDEHWRAALEPPTSPGSLGRLGDYDVIEILGSGGMGVVLRGRDSVLNREVAIKFPHLRSTRTEQSQQRFLNEARSAAALEHENVVRVYQVGVQHDEPFLVMELIEGETLQDLFNQQEPVSSEELRKIAVQAARALEAAHRQGLLHGDVKPANLLIKQDTGQIKLSDFGLARAISDERTGEKSTIAGTPEYMSPEQAGGRTVDARSDLYSLGAVLYALATGTMPTSGTDLDDLLRRIETDPIVPVRQRNPGLDGDLARMIDRLLRKQPGERPASAEEVAATLSLDRKRFWRTVVLASLTTITLAACFFVAEFAGWIDTVAGIGPQEIVELPRPFQIVGRDLSFDTLEETIEYAVDGDVIEVCSPGPHAVRPIQIRDKTLTIRGVDGQPAIIPFQSGEREAPIISTNAALNLESLEFQFQAPGISEDSQTWQNCAVLAQQAPVKISKSRFRISRGNAAIAVDSGDCWMDDCEIYGGLGMGIMWNPGNESHLTIQNSVFATRVGVFIEKEGESKIDDAADIKITNTTVRAGSLFLTRIDVRAGQRFENIPSLQISGNDNFFDLSHFVSFASARRFSIEMRVQRARRIFRNSFAFSGEKNRFRPDTMLAVLAMSPPVSLFGAERTSDTWKQFLKDHQNAIEFGNMKFIGPADSQDRNDHRVASFNTAIEGNFP